MTNQEVSAFIENLSQPWQIEVSNQLRQLVDQVIPEAEERILEAPFPEEWTLCGGYITVERCHCIHDHELFRPYVSETI